MKQLLNAKNLIVICAFLIFGYFLLSKNSNVSINNTQNFLEHIYQNSQVKQVSNNSYLLNSKKIFTKELTIDNKIILITTENYEEQGAVYNFFLFGQIKPLKEVASLAGAVDAETAFDPNHFFLKDITGDKIPEIFVLVEQAQSGGNSYEILRLEKDIITNIKLESQNNNWVGFDDVDLKDGYVYMTWHAVDAIGKTKYKLENNSLIPIKNIGYFQTQNTEGECEVRENKLYDDFVVIHKDRCSILGNNFDRFLK